jgi:plastocyanin
MRSLAFAVVVGLVALAGCGGSMSPSSGGGGGGSCTPTATRVCLMNSAFNPTTLTIMHGTTVTWVNADAYAHSVTSATGSPDTYDSGQIAGGGMFSHLFATAGTYNYYCYIHGANGTPPTGMHASITVN